MKTTLSIFSLIGIALLAQETQAHTKAAPNCDIKTLTCGITYRMVKDDGSFVGFTPLVATVTRDVIRGAILESTDEKFDYKVAVLPGYFQVALTLKKSKSDEWIASIGSLCTPPAFYSIVSNDLVTSYHEKISGGRLDQARLVCQVNSTSVSYEGRDILSP